MDPELKRELDQSLLLAKDNNRILHAMRRSQWVGFVMKVLFWIAAIVLPLYLYQQYLQPFVAKFSPAGSTASSAFHLPTSADLQKLLDSFKAGK